MMNSSSPYYNLLQARTQVKQEPKAIVLIWLFLVRGFGWFLSEPRRPSNFPWRPLVIYVRDIDNLSKRDIHILSKRDTHILSKRDIHNLSKRDIHILSKRDIHILSKRDIHILSKRDIHILSNTPQALHRESLIKICGSSMKTWGSPDQKLRR